MLKLMIAKESVAVCLDKAYSSRISATTRYRSMDSALENARVQHKDIYNYLVKQYKLDNIDVKSSSAEERAIHLYQDHVARFFLGKWTKVRTQAKRVKGIVIKVKKGNTAKAFTEKRAEALIKDSATLEVLIRVLKDFGYNVVKTLEA